MNRLMKLVAALAVVLPFAAQALDEAEIPTDAPQDAVMASAAESTNEAREKETKTLKGRELMEDFELSLPQRGTSLLVRLQAK